jgi:hypothetical protein
MACFKNANPITGFGMFEPDAPEVPSYQQQLQTALGAQQGIMPQLYAAEAYWQPKWDELSQQRMNRYLGTEGQPGMLDTYAQVGSRMGQIESDVASAQRARDIGDVGALSPQAYAAMRGFNPQQTELMDALNAQARQQLQLGGAMSPDQQRMFQNSVMGQRSAAGWGYNPGDMAEAVRQATGYSDQLQQSRMRQAQLQAGQNQAIYGDPFMQILGRQGQAFSSIPGTTVMGQQAQQNTGPSLFQPESQMGFDIWNTGYQGELGANIAGANNNAALFGALLGAGGSVGGAAMCWVAREIYGPTDIRWLQFRRYVCMYAPGWFFRLYRDHGQRFASWLRKNGRIQRVCRPYIRKYMDRKIREMQGGSNHQPSTINHQPTV